MVFLAVMGLAQVCLGQTNPPREINGFRLGEEVKGYLSRLDWVGVENDLTEDHLRMVAIRKTEHFRSGLLAFGACAQPGQVLRVKLNYDDQSLDFFDKVLAALKDRYGEPDKWRGNPFGTLRTWKWSFTDPKLGDISLILQHYSGKDDAYTKGNSIRISATSLIQRELDCYNRKRPPAGNAPASPEASRPDWYLPR
jgi:hypothetical protein